MNDRHKWDIIFKEHYVRRNRRSFGEDGGEAVSFGYYQKTFRAVVIEHTGLIQDQPSYHSSFEGVGTDELYPFLRVYGKLMVPRRESMRVNFI